jgi:hypothetical protein
MTVPQLPGPNFFDVYMRQDAGTYGEIIKVADQTAPTLSFITVFTNGVWFSTNGFKGTNQQLDFLVSSFDPGASTDQLYAQHQQDLNKIRQENSWDIEEMSQNRYMAAFSDEVREYLYKKGLQAYQADLASWH